jgi:chromosome segregation protein
MYLKALEMQGFKSFPDKTRLTFEKDITAIVGPNGSGKSNISDAILWVMGEQRTKTLRGGKMEDVVFGGTEKRPKMGFAQVSLVIDNTGRIFDTDSAEVMITRRYYRSGESEYYINREAVRLKDIGELLMDTGLGRDGYSVIGQGKISEVVSSKSTDRRKLFEEASGISRYRYRKDESERKLMGTDENLVRINDKIDELKITLGPLREQAETAKKYLVLRDGLRLLEVSVWMETLDRLHERAQAVKEDWEQAKAGFEAAQTRQQALYEVSEDLTEKMREKDLEAEKRRSELDGAEAACAECESALAVLENSLAHNAERSEQLRAEMSEQGARTAALESQIAGSRGRIAEIGRELTALEEKARGLSETLSGSVRDEDGAKQARARLFAERSEKQAALAHSRAVLSMLAASADEQRADDLKRAADAEAARERRNALAGRLASAEMACKAAGEKTEELKNIVEGHSLRLQGREGKVKALGEKHTGLAIACNSVKSRVAMLAEMEKEFEGYSQAVKTVMRERGRGTLKGIYGPVANLLKTDDRYTTAIETALGAAMQSIAVRTQEQGKAAIEMLKRRDAGRATFLPADTIKGAALKRRPENENGYLGTAFELVRFDPEFTGIFSNLLGRTVVAETLGDAVAMSRRYDNQLRIVTLDGQLINAGGSMTGGSAAKNSGILSRANELKKLRAEAEALEKEERECAAALSEATRELNSAKYALQAAEGEQREAVETLHTEERERAGAALLLDEADKRIAVFSQEEALSALRLKENAERAGRVEAEISALETAEAGLEKSLAALSVLSAEHERQSRTLSEALTLLAEKRSSLISEKETTRAAIDQLGELTRDLAGDVRTREEALKALEAGNNALEDKKRTAAERLSASRAAADGLRAEIITTNAARLALEGERTLNEKRAQDLNRELVDMERLCGGIEQKKLASEMEEKQIIDKLWESYELSRTAAQGVREPISNMAESTKRISGLKREISALGSPNVGAIAEYDRIAERYNYLAEQRDDVEKAKRSLERIIADITGEMREIFLREFRVIDESFRSTFLELFGGGRAALILEDEDDILNCGIEIKVQLPGQALKTLSLLSGGETACVAIALYFAIIRVRPTPFCIMDEIETALDEANVDRFARYLRGVAGRTQFVVITHRRGTMEEADLLYGVTMQEKGVSQVLSVDLAEAERALSKQGGPAVLTGNAGSETDKRGSP